MKLPNKNTGYPIKYACHTSRESFSMTNPQAMLGYNHTKKLFIILNSINWCPGSELANFHERNRYI